MGEDPNALLKILGAISAFRQHVGERVGAFAADPLGTLGQGIADTTRDPALDFVPGVGDLKGLAVDAPEQFAAGNPVLGMLAAASIVPGVSFSVLKELFEGPMKKAADAGNFSEAATLLRQLQKARDVPLGADEGFKEFDELIDLIEMLGEDTP